MYTPTLALLLCFTFFSQETKGHAQDFDVDHVISDINRNLNNAISTDEVNTFFQSSAMSRCEFTRWMVPMYSGDSTLISALYDAMQKEDVASLTREEFREALKPQSPDVTTDQLKDNLAKVLEKVHDMSYTPYQFTEGPGMFDVSSFRVEQWADDADTDNTGTISQEEISRWMRQVLDADDNSVLERCEFVDAMIAYAQHSAAAAKVYDVIFESRDHTWADVDSAFLAIQISRKDSQTISTTEFIRFFTYQNELASGAVVLDRVDVNGGNTRSTSLTTTAVCLLAFLSLVAMRH